MVANGLRIFRSSQTCTLLSSEADTILSCLVNTAEVTDLKKEKKKKKNSGLENKGCGNNLLGVALEN